MAPLAAERVSLGPREACYYPSPLTVASPKISQSMAERWVQVTTSMGKTHTLWNWHDSTIAGGYHSGAKFSVLGEVSRVKNSPEGLPRVRRGILTLQWGTEFLVT